MSNGACDDRRYDLNRLLPPATLYQPVDELFAGLKGYSRFDLLPLSPTETKAGRHNLPIGRLPELTSTPSAPSRWHCCGSFDQLFGASALCTESEGRRESLRGICCCRSVICVSRSSPASRRSKRFRCVAASWWHRWRRVRRRAGRLARAGASRPAHHPASPVRQNKKPAARQ